MAAQEANWRPFALIISLSVIWELVALLMPVMEPLTLSRLGYAAAFVTQLGAGAEPGAGGAIPTGAPIIAEIQGLGLTDLFAYHFLLIPMGFALYTTLRRWRRADVFCLSWFFALFFLSLFTKRVFIYAIPAACLLSGVGLVTIFDFRRRHRYQRILQRLGAGLLIFCLLFISLSAFSTGSGGRAAPNDNWYDALLYLKAETPPEAVIMTTWDYGNWILDVAQRTPVVDNGLHGHPPDKLHDISLAYCATDAAEAVVIMEKYGASYLVFSTLEIGVLHHITNSAWGQAYGDGQSIPEEMKDSLYSRSLAEDFQGEDGLEVVYRNPEVVILGLK